MAEMAPAEAAGTFRLGFAGDTFNTAWYLARLGVEASYFTALGTDALSAQLHGFLRQSGVSGGHIRTIEGGTVGLYLISLEDGERSFSYWRGQSAARQLAQDAAALDSAMADADLVFFSGITLAILEPDARAAFLEALGRARAAGKRIAFDPNLRPRLWPDPETMTRAIMQGAACCDIALPSFEDEADWFGDADPAGTAARYAAVGAQTIVVKNGADPVLWQNGAQSGTVAVPQIVKIVDTTAAGDSFNAGFFAGLVAGASLEESVARACALAREVVQGRGALVWPDGAKAD